KGSKVFAYCRGDSSIRGRCQPNAVRLVTDDTVEDRLKQSEAARDQQSAQLQELIQVIQQLHGAQNAMIQNNQATAAVHPVAMSLEDFFDGSTAQFYSWRITIEDRLTSDGSSGFMSTTASWTQSKRD
ncbi:hypothetical protein E4U52_001855, partial [Claviceps spartinae]